MTKKKEMNEQIEVKEEAIPASNPDMEAMIAAITEEALAKVREQAKGIIAAAEKEADRIKSGGAAEVDMEAIRDREAGMKELVDVFLFKDGDKYKDDVFVGVNGRTWVIKRGVTVKVPRYVKEVLDNSMNQILAASEAVNEAAKNFEEGQ